MVFSIDLSKKINAAQLNPDTLVGKYVPNLVAKPFQVSKEYAQLIYDQTLSPRLDKVLRKWDQDSWGAEEHRQKLAYVILVEHHQPRQDLHEAKTFTRLRFLCSEESSGLWHPGAF